MGAVDYHGFEPGRRPAIEVHIGRRWHPGALRSWIRRAGVWWAHVDYRLPEDGTHTATVPVHAIRSDDPRASPPTDQGSGTGDPPTHEPDGEPADEEPARRRP